MIDISSLPRIDSREQNLVKTIKGNSPMLFTCGHGGEVPPIQGCKRELTNLSDDCHGMFNTLTDYHTLDITYGTATNILQLTKKLPWVVMFNGLRACVDVNREEKCAFEAPEAKIFYDEYHENIKRSIKEIYAKNMGENNQIFLFDFHGASFEFQVRYHHWNWQRRDPMSTV